MHNSVLFTTLHLHAGQEEYAPTLSKTLAVYSNDLFQYDKDEFYETSVEIKSVIHQHTKNINGHDTELFRYFVWNLN